MLPIPSLPLTDGKLLLDNSALELLRCPRLFQLQFLMRRALATARAGRNFGSTIHAGQATRYRMSGSDRVTESISTFIQESMRVWLEAHPQPMEDFRNFDHACRVMDAYNANYQDEPFKLLKKSDGSNVVECSFLLPFATVQGIEVWYMGKIDLGIEDHNGIWIMDTKTAFQWGTNWEAGMGMDAGQLGYCWGLSNILGGLRVNGYVINGIRIRRPTKKSEYEGTPPVDSSDFMRLPHFVQPEDIERWKENTIKVIETMLYQYKRGYFEERRHSCVLKYGRCDMYDVCSLPQGSQLNALMGNMYEENTWTPLNPPEGGEV
jgi:hypothetical protein